MDELHLKLLVGAIYELPLPIISVLPNSIEIDCYFHYISIFIYHHKHSKCPNSIAYSAGFYSLELVYRFRAQDATVNANLQTIGDVDVTLADSIESVTSAVAAPQPTSVLSPTSNPTVREAWNPTADPAKTLTMGFVAPLSDVLNADSKISQTPEPQPISSPTATAEPKKWGVGVHTQLSTTGFIGVDAGYKFSPNLHARLGLNTVGFGYNYSSQGVDYNASFSPTNVHLLGDYFPFGGGLRLTSGFVFQGNRFSGSAKSNASNQFTINGTTYNASQVGQIDTSGSFSNSVAPYLGIGFGSPISPGFGFNVDLGVMFAGSPNVSLSANNVSPSIPASVQNQFRSDLAAQQQKTNSDIGGFNVFPVLSLGFSYAF
jgi:hypothetical protein